MLVVMGGFDIFVSANFMLSIFVALVGGFFGGYCLLLFVALLLARDVKGILKSRFHRAILRGFNYPGAKIIIVAFSLCAPIIMMGLIVSSYNQLRYGGGLSPLASRDYMSMLGGIGAFYFGLVVEIASGDKGMVLPVGKDFSISVDKGGVVAIHLRGSKPKIKSAFKKVRPFVESLRGDGVDSPLVLKSWIFVSPPDPDHESVKFVRNVMRFVQWPSLVLARFSLSFLHRSLLGKSLFLHVVPAITAPFVALYFSRSAAVHLSKLPEISLRDPTYDLKCDLQRGTCCAVEEIEPASVSLSTMVALAVRFPALAESFGGKDGGLIVSP